MTSGAKYPTPFMVKLSLFSWNWQKLLGDTILDVSHSAQQQKAKPCKTTQQWEHDSNNTTGVGIVRLPFNEACACSFPAFSDSKLLSDWSGSRTAKMSSKFANLLIRKFKFLLLCFSWTKPITASCQLNHLTRIYDL